MTRYSSFPNTVLTIANVTIPPYSECVFPVSTFKPALKGEYIIEENLRSPCRALLVAQALVNPTHRKLPCRVLNPTDKQIFLKAHTPIGELAPVTIASISATSHQRANQLPSVSAMRAALEDKQI